MFYARQLELLFVINGVVLNESNHNNIKVVFDIDIQTGQLEFTQKVNQLVHHVKDTK